MSYGEVLASEPFFSLFFFFFSFVFLIFFFTLVSFTLSIYLIIIIIISCESLLSCIVYFFLMLAPCFSVYCFFSSSHGKKSYFLFSNSIIFSSFSQIYVFFLIYSKPLFLLLTSLSNRHAFAYLLFMYVYTHTYAYTY